MSALYVESLDLDQDLDLEGDDVIAPDVVEDARTHLRPPFAMADLMSQKKDRQGRLHNVFNCGREFVDVIYRMKRNGWRYATWRTTKSAYAA